MKGTYRNDLFSRRPTVWRQYVVRLKQRAIEYDKQLGIDYNPQIVRIDIIAAFVAGELTEQYMLDLSTDEAFDKNLRSACSREFLDYYRIDYHWTKAASNRLNETLLRCRGLWWTDWAVLVNDGNAVLDKQVGVYDNTEFGT